MKRAAWKQLVLACVLAVSMVVLPITATLDAQQPAPRTDTRTVDDDNDFPWGILGLLGLIGLAGLSRRAPARSFENEPARRH